MGDEKYCYPNSNVLKNKYGLTNLVALEQIERKSSSLAIVQLQSDVIKGNFDLKHLQSIHKAIFSDIYDWAGKIRTVDIAKSNLFCRVQFLDSYSQDIFGRLKKQDNFLLGLPKQQAIKKLAEYMGDINALHPFREGNGRTQREFIKYLSKVTGIELHMDKVTSDRMMDASLKSFNTDYSGFEQIFNEIAKPMTLEEQESFIKSISRQVYKEFKELKQQLLLPDRQLEFMEEQKQYEQQKESTKENIQDGRTVDNSVENKPKTKQMNMSDYMAEIAKAKEANKNQPSQQQQQKVKDKKEKTDR